MTHFILRKYSQAIFTCQFKFFNTCAKFHFQFCFPSGLQRFYKNVRILGYQTSKGKKDLFIQFFLYKFKLSIYKNTKIKRLITNEWLKNNPIKLLIRDIWEMNKKQMSKWLNVKFYQYLYHSLLKYNWDCYHPP